MLHPENHHYNQIRKCGNTIRDPQLNSGNGIPLCCECIRDPTSPQLLQMPNSFHSYLDREFLELLGNQANFVLHQNCLVSPHEYCPLILAFLCSSLNLDGHPSVNADRFEMLTDGNFDQPLVSNKWFQVLDKNNKKSILFGKKLLRKS